MGSSSALSYIFRLHTKYLPPSHISSDSVTGFLLTTQSSGRRPLCALYLLEQPSQSYFRWPPWADTRPLSGAYKKKGPVAQPADSFWKVLLESFWRARAAGNRVIIRWESGYCARPSSHLSRWAGRPLLSTQLQRVGPNVPSIPEGWICKEQRVFTPSHMYMYSGDKSLRRLLGTDCFHYLGPVQLWYSALTSY